MLIVDPPRRGLFPDLISDLCRSPDPNQPCIDRIDHLTPEYGQRPKPINPVNIVATLIYVSCGFDALARDTDRLLSSGGGAGNSDGQLWDTCCFRGAITSRPLLY